MVGPRLGGPRPRGKVSAQKVAPDTVLAHLHVNYSYSDANHSTTNALQYVKLRNVFLLRIVLSFALGRTTVQLGIGVAVKKVLLV